MKSGRILSIVLMIAFFYAESAFGVSITNGSLTGPIVNTGVPSGWSIILESPDTMDETHNVGTTTTIFGITPSGPSPDGGTWVGFARDGDFIERFGQEVTGLEIGTQYNLSWYQGNFGVGGSFEYIAPNAIEVLLDSSSVGSGSLLVLDPNWTPDSIVFTATSTSHQIDFKLLNADRSYLSIDGIAVAVVPEPSTALLLASGFVGLAVVRRRRG